MLSRILQSINTNVRELSGRQLSPLSPISAKAVSADEKNYDPGVPPVQKLENQESLAEEGDDNSRQPPVCRGDLPLTTKQPVVTVSSHMVYPGDKVMIAVTKAQLTYRKKDAVHLEKTVELCLKAKSLNSPPSRSSTRLSRTVHLANYKSSIRHVEVRQINLKRKLSNQQALDTRKKHRKDLKTQVTDSVISTGNGDTKSSKPRIRWCRRCGTIETCRWRTSPAGSQT
jgi:hypothetical protein